MKVNIAKWPKRAVAAILAVLLAITFLPFSNFNLVTAKAEVGDTPEHDKDVTPNGDGTYTIELSVTGDADTEVETAADVNVLIIYDESSSMTSNNVSTNPNRNRADYAEDVMHDFIVGLRTYQSGDGSNIQVALVGFGPTVNNSNITQTWTSNLADTGQGINRFFDDGVDGTVTGAHNYGQHNGTNWEAALQRAQTYLNSADADPTFVLLVTDGACTASGNGNNAINPAGNRPWTDFQPFYNAARDEALAIAGRANTTLFGIYAYGREADLLDDLIYYSQNGSNRPGMDGGTDETPNYYNAADTTALNDAIKEIFHKIVEALGVSSVEITDGTTNEVKVGTNTVELLEVDESSYKYWLSVPIVNNQFQRIDLVSGETITYTVSADGKTVSWPDNNSVTVNGTISNNQLRYEWTGANALYDKAPPGAELIDGAVEWDLSSAGTLLDGVTYSVTFKCYPSQTTLDYVADIRNHPYVSETDQGAWGALPPEIQKYIDKDGNLLTNTETSLTWRDTRETLQQPHETTFPEQDPVENDAVEQLAVSKQWKNKLESEWDKPTSIKLDVMRGDERHESVTLNDDNAWTDSVYISIGIMGEDGQPLEGAEGHDFTFDEPHIEGASYQWEINVPVVHPMLINNEMVMLEKVDAKHPLPEGTPEANIYQFNGATYYVNEEAAALTAVNERRSSLNLKKVVVGDDAPADAVFPFTLHVNNPLAPATAPSEQADPGHDSDYWIWISVRDKDGNRINEGVEGATSAGGGWWYAENDTDVTIPVKDGYSIRVNNLPTGTTYTITEGNLPEAFIFGNATIAFTEGEKPNPGWTFNGGQTSTGSIDSTNAVYTVTYTNKYELVDINVNKVWDDNSNQDGKRPEKLALTLNGAPEGTTVSDPTITKSADGNTWTYTWAGLPKYDSAGEEIEYTVTETTVPDGYTCEERTVADEGTITNKHTPEVTEATVKKEWDDANNQDGARPTELKVTLSNGTEVILKESNQWTAKVDNLPKYANGQEIKYTWTETVPTGYTMTSNATVGTVTTITNKHTPEETTATITKNWVDDNNRDNIRPTELNVSLNENVTVNNETTTTIVKTVTLKASENWTTTVTKLPKYKNGNLITYTWTEEEDQVPKGYSVSYGEGQDAAANGGTITNTHEPEKTEAIVVKVWEDANNQDGKRPETLSVTLYKTVGQSAPAEVQTVTLSASEDPENNWRATVTDLLKYEAGNLITYTWEEGTMPEGYRQTSSIPDGTVTTITNEYEPKKTTATVKKVWDDAENQDGMRPETLSVTLYKTVGQSTPAEVQTVTLSASEEEASNWTATVTELPMYDNGSLIKYTWSEADITGYTMISNVTEGTLTTITNKHTPETIKVAVKKVWDDSEDKYGIRPTSLAVTLNKTIGESAPVVVQKVTLSASEEEENNWTATLEVPKYSNQQEIKYTWTEDTVPTGYELLPSEVTTADDGTTTTMLTNKLKLGDLIIEKDLSTFQHFEGQDRFVTIVFHVQATLNGKLVFDKYMPVQMEGASVSKIEILKQIPVGATVAITEEYSGAGYSDVEAIDPENPPQPKTATIADPDVEEPVTAKVTFKNTYTDQRDGYGIVNQYSHDGTGWSVEQKDPTKKSSDDPGTEPED